MSQMPCLQPIGADLPLISLIRSLAALGLRLKSNLRGELVVVPAGKAVRHG